MAIKEENTKKNSAIDPIFEKVAKAVLVRGVDMNKKHGNKFDSVERHPVELIQEIEEELIDGLVYLQKLKGVLDGKKIY